MLDFSQSNMYKSPWHIRKEGITMAFLGLAEGGHQTDSLPPQGEGTPLMVVHYLLDVLSADPDVPLSEEPVLGTGKPFPTPETDSPC